METQTKNGKHVQNGIAKQTINTVAQNGEANKEITNGKAEAEKPKATPAVAEKPEGKQEQPKVEEPNKEEPKAEQLSAEAHQPAKPVQTLEATLRTVDTLHRRSVQRLNLISRLKQIEAFEVALAQESDELEDNPYQGCKLIIEDDKQRRFITTTPGLIRLVSQFIFSACNEKLAEIEASIVFPNA